MSVLMLFIYKDLYLIGIADIFLMELQQMRVLNCTGSISHITLYGPSVSVIEFCWES